MYHSLHCYHLHQTIPALFSDLLLLSIQSTNSSKRSRVPYHHFLLQLYRYDIDHDKIVEHKKLLYQYWAINILRYYYNTVIPPSPSIDSNEYEGISNLIN